MNDQGAADFLLAPFATAAIALRHWDDEANSRLAGPYAAHYPPMLQAVEKRSEAIS